MCRSSRFGCSRLPCTWRGWTARSQVLLAASCVAMGLAALGQSGHFPGSHSVSLRPQMANRRDRDACSAHRLARMAAFRARDHRSASGRRAGHLHVHYGFEALIQKLKSAAALTAHLAWLVFPALWLPPLMALPAAIGAAFYDLNPLFWGSIAIGIGILIWCARNWRDFLAQWVLIFFAGALVIFFAGSARYLLPIALPVAILATRRAGLRMLHRPCLRIRAERAAGRGQLSTLERLPSVRALASGASADQSECGSMASGACNTISNPKAGFRCG